MMTADEMIEVIQAWKDGKEIEFKSKYRNDEWGNCFEPAWNFDKNDYRIKPAAIAAGRNPEKLTVDQIKGYRCLSEEEYDALEEGSTEPDVYYLNSEFDVVSCDAMPSHRIIHKAITRTYFTDKREGYFLPKLDTLKPYWSKPEDVPIQQGGIWLRDKNEAEGHTALIIGITANGVILISKEFYSWEELQEKEYYNGTKWKECRCL